MTNEQKAKAFIRAIKKFLDKIPNLKQYTIHDENQIYDAIVNNKDKWFWRFDITVEYYISIGQKDTSDWVTKLYKYLEVITKSLDIENLILPDIKFIAEVRD